MANVDKAFGLRPYKGAGWPVQQANKYNISPASGYGTSIFQGDLCIFNGGQLFLIQADGASAVTCIGRNADTDGIGGSTTTGVATRELDSTSINTTLALQLKIVGVVQDDSNGDLTADNANLVVLINEHYMRGGVAGT